jgi:Peptidase family M23
MLLILALQLFLPLLFIGWLCVAPPHSSLAFCTQAIATAVALFAVSLIGLWLFPPWWAPWVFGALLLAAVLLGWKRRSPFTSWLPRGWLDWGVTIVFIAIGSWGVYQSANALAGHGPQPGSVVELAFPLKAGEYLIVNGGSHLSINAHLMTLDASMARFQAYRGQSYGVDIVKLDRWGLRANGLMPTEPSAYNIYGVPVYAPCVGMVIAALDGVPDMPVPQMDREHMAGNHVLLRCIGADVLLGHFKPGSLKVTVGQQVAVGQRIADAGNSGNTTEPHLHVHAQQRGTTEAPVSGDPLPIRFDGRFLVRNDRVSTTGR